MPTGLAPGGGSGYQERLGLRSPREVEAQREWGPEGNLGAREGPQWRAGKWGLGCLSVTKTQGARERSDKAVWEGKEDTEDLWLGRTRA